MTNPIIEPSIEFSEAAIFSRLLQVEKTDDLSPELAKHIVSPRIRQIKRMDSFDSFDSSDSWLSFQNVRIETGEFNLKRRD